MVNRKSWVPDQMVSVLMTLSETFDPDFKVTTFFEVEYHKTVRFRDIEH